MYFELNIPSVNCKLRKIYKINQLHSTVVASISVYPNGLHSDQEHQASSEKLQ